ncbi:MAG: hypothetical protein ACFFE5_11745 [Candidatus Thorarchaeota archaeon]
MSATTQEIGNCEKCGLEINLAEAWRVDEKYYCQSCFDLLDL